MNQTRSIRQPKSQIIRRERDSSSWRYCFFAVVCILSLSVGFFGAARQHFSSIQLSIENSAMKTKIEKLETEQRNLLLMKEIALSPAEVKKIARKNGFTEMTAGNIEVYNPAPEKDSAANAVFNNVLVTKTVDVKPIIAENKIAPQKLNNGKTGIAKKSEAEPVKNKNGELKK